MTKQQIQAVLEAHGKWMRGEEAGVRANLSGSDLRHANMSNANLTGAHLFGANLSCSDLRGADLSGSDLRHADLTRADLRGADLTRADLRFADLRGADVTGAINAPLVASVGWTDHGECGRVLTAGLHDSTGPEPVYQCGCFAGSADELRQYIADGAADLRESRTEALEIVSGLMARMIARREHSA